MVDDRQAETSTPPGGGTVAIAHEYLLIDRTCPRAGVEVCSVTGELDLLTTPLLQRALSATRRPEITSVVVDLSGVDFLSVRGARALCAAAATAAAGEQCFALVVTSRAVSRGVELTGSGDEISCFGSLADALRAVDAPWPDAEAAACGGW